MRAQGLERRQFDRTTAPGVEGLAKQRVLPLQRCDVALDAAMVFGAAHERGERLAELGSVELQAWARGGAGHRAATFGSRDPVTHQAATARNCVTSAKAASAAALPCAIESSIVSGPLAAPATKTPRRDVSPSVPYALALPM